MLRIGDPRGWWLVGLAAAFLAALLWRSRRRTRELTTFFLLRRLAEELPASGPLLRRRTLIARLLFAAAALCGAAAALDPYYTSGAPALRELAIVDLAPTLGIAAGGAPRIDRLRGLLEDYLDLLQRGDTVQFVTAGPEAGATPPLDHRAARAWLTRLDHADAAQDRPGAERLARLVASRGRFDHVLLFSDRPERWSALLAAEGGLAPRPHPIAFGEGTAGAGIVAFDLRPDLASASTYDLYLRAACPLPPPGGEVALAFLGNGRPLRELRRPCGPERPAEVLLAGLELEPGSLEVRLLPGDAYAADDAVQAGVGGPSRVRVHLVTPGNRFLEAALRAHAGLELTVSAPEAAPAPAADAIHVVDGAVPYAQLPDRALFIQPDRPIEELRYQAVRSYPERVDAEPGDPLLEGVDLEGLAIRGYLAYPDPGGFTVSAAADGQPLILRAERGGRRWVVLAFNPAESQLVYAPGFPLLVANAVRWLSFAHGGAEPFHRAGERVALPPAARGGRVRLPGGGSLELPAGAGAPRLEARHPGRYEIAAGDGSPLGALAVNVLDPAVTAEAAGPAGVGGAASFPPGIERGPLRVETAPWLALAALLFLALEARLAAGGGSRRIES